MKVFISQPMRDKTNEEIKAERARIVIVCKNKYPGEDIEIIDSFFEDAPHDATPLWFLGKSLQLLSTADLAFFAKGYECARGCVIEYECALAYGINHIEEGEVIFDDGQNI